MCSISLTHHACFYQTLRACFTCMLTDNYCVAVCPVTLLSHGQIYGGLYRDPVIKVCQGRFPDVGGATVVICQNVIRLLCDGVMAIIHLWCQQGQHVANKRSDGFLLYPSIAAAQSILRQWHFLVVKDWK